jgi:hypothetical protein
MKSKIISLVTLVFALNLAFVSYAQEEVAAINATTETSSYDPLVPQQFAVDSKTQTMVVINNNENTIEILERNGNQYERTETILVDKYEGRHDLHAIYRPQSVAVYENHIVYLASHRDSSYVKVLTLGGTEKETFKFRGAAQAFSYDVVTKLLYIAGSNAAGYNVFVVDATGGFENLKVEGSPAYQYVKPKKAEVLQKHDPTGGVLALISVLVVFFVLILITVVLHLVFGKLMVGNQNKKAAKAAAAKQAEGEKSASPAKKASDISGEEFAAIAAAIHLYNDEMHDEESAILTINKVAKVYSPWSSKMHNMNPYRR